MEHLPQILRITDVTRITGLSRPAIYYNVKRGLFPRQIQLGPRSVGWLASDVEAWFQSRISARDAQSA
ncbi:helix-turn-helix transcriptional regulator [Bordetella petrii]|uniref:AlpA family transcriptional regulator n=1 Tax=Bordetella petrii (strain ATCC BAA-461 / DSM 12804 / CCUG 43448 / CIP 107267 / Se-1111R) TaxID=340100 RepID=A9IRW1_BORPD|nr:AlpA family transcriptional regulator [Bordetella petrii]CAP43224.1 unnamed protein product [Bordetella petrii]